MTNTKTELIFKNEPWNDKIDLAIFQGSAVVDSINFKPKRHGELIRPCLSLTWDEAQTIFNQLWNMGFRPKDGTGNSGHIEAIKYHLEDMRTIALGKKK